MMSVYYLHCPLDVRAPYHTILCVPEARLFHARRYLGVIERACISLRKKICTRKEPPLTGAVQ